MKRLAHTRRCFLEAAPALAGGWRLLAAEDDRLAVRDPRATVGDDVVAPKWDTGIEITVGPDKADVVGATGKAIQAAVDYAARWGGGTVRVLPGTYQLRNAVFLQSGVRLSGSGPDTVLVKGPSVRTKLALDADFYEQEVTLADPKGFEVGDGVCFRAQSQRHKGVDIFTRTLVARSGNRFKLDRPLPGYPGISDLWLEGDASAATLFALIHGEGITDAAVENIMLDGNKANNEFLNGNHTGCIYLLSSNRVTIRKVTARNFNGDGISWQTSHDVTVEECRSQDNAGLGLHPGSGAKRPTARRNRLERNDIGFYFCWGVKWGVVEDNVILDSKRFGIHFGHNDTDNIARRNEIRNSGRAGVIFIPGDGRVAPPNYCRLEANRILDNGGEDGIGVDVQGTATGLVIARNEILETRVPAKRTGVKIAAEVGEVKLIENKIEGFSIPLSDLRRTAG